MKKIEINIQEKSATINAMATSFEELGLSHTDTTDPVEIKEDLIDIHGEDTEVSFTWSVEPGIYSVNVQDLADLGWNIDNDEVATAMNISIEEADEYVDKTYHADIHVEQDGTTNWRLVNTEKSLNGIDEGGDSEATGDDTQTLKDIQQLIKNGKIWKTRIF